MGKLEGRDSRLSATSSSVVPHVDCTLCDITISGLDNYTSVLAAQVVFCSELGRLCAHQRFVERFVVVCQRLPWCAHRLLAASRVLLLVCSAARRRRARARDLPRARAIALSRARARARVPSIAHILDGETNIARAIYEADCLAFRCVFIHRCIRLQAGQDRLGFHGGQYRLGFLDGQIQRS